MRVRGTSCMVPSPLCGDSVSFISFISKTRIKITFSMKLNKPAQKSVFFSMLTVLRRCSRIAFPNQSPRKTILDDFIVLRWVAIPMLLILQRDSLALALQRHLSTALAKLGLRLISLLFVSVPPCWFTVVRVLPTGPARVYVLELARCAARNGRNTFREYVWGLCKIY